MPLLISLHALAAVVWVGGMFFACMVLRPAAQSLDAAPRLRLWESSFRRFFPWVWAAVIAILVTGYGMIFGYLGGMGRVGAHVNIMQTAGIFMMLLFLHIFFGPFRRLKQALAAGDLEAAAHRLDQIRRYVAINLALGIFVIVVAVGGRFPL